MVRNRFRIVLIPDLICRYQARDTLLKLDNMLYQYGLFKPLVNWKLKRVATVRQLVPLFLILYLIGGVVISLIWPTLFSIYLYGIVLYLLFILAGSIKAYTPNKKLSLLPYCFITFPIMHVSYGWGYLHGIGELMFRTNNKQKEVKLSR